MSYHERTGRPPKIAGDLAVLCRDRLAHPTDPAAPGPPHPDTPPAPPPKARVKSAATTNAAVTAEGSSNRRPGASGKNSGCICACE
ncbi:MAG TPA: hypothetical protein VH092_29820 [Urbifossiella sp.]|jgi:hypothetical protein|nr:hypothetical protein [Urbifossiella sp.]